MKKNKFYDQGNALKVQKHQLQKSETQIGKIYDTINTLEKELDRELDFENFLSSEASFIIEDDEHGLVEVVENTENNIDNIEIERLELLDNVSFDDDWEIYLTNLEVYAKNNHFSLENNPFDSLLTQTQRVQFEKWVKEDFTIKSANCDKYDYLIAATSGLIGGLIDVFLVGAPGKGYLTHFSDDITDKCVMKFARLSGWKGGKEGKDPLPSAIGFLEKKYKINYDHRHTKDVGGKFKMNTKNHHIKSLGHSPDLLGLFFSILDQFTNMASFISEGKIIRVENISGSYPFILKGKNIIEKLFFGFVNWIGHLFSDVAGSSGTRGQFPNSRGSGIPIPFFSWLQFLDFGKFGPDKQTFATIAVRVFQEGYDFRHGIALAIPVVITELITRIMWVLKRRFYHECDWKDCLPSAKKPELRRMLLISHGTLCLVDATDATLRSGGNIITFMLNANFVAWLRLGTVALKEIPSWYAAGSLDISSVNDYLDKEYIRLTKNT